MFKKDAIEFFGGPSSVARAAGVAPPTVTGWGEMIPEGRAHRLAEASGGVLNVSTRDVYDRYRKSRRKAGKNTASLHKESD